ncbi:MAG TPA: sulfite exporter TauE/SafE family protein [Rubrobacter sp.]|nr:sulfite exporter TauE/SafE family protein [Rubrobacter sp.]
MTLVLVLVAALLVGALIGCVGIGGVLLPPALVYLGGLGFHAAAATSTWAFLFCAAAGTWRYSGRGSIDWQMAGWLGAGVVPAAFLGARVNAALPDALLMSLLAALMVLTGADVLLRRSRGSDGGARRLGAPALLAIGAFVGFGSALTGTGGAVLLVPILLLLQIPVLTAVGAAQAVALPVAAFATAGFLLYGSVDFAFGTAAGLVGAAGVVAGAQIAHAAPAAALRRVVAVALLCAGLLIAAQIAWGALRGDAARAADLASASATSVAREQLIPTGSPVDFVPAWS